MHLPDKLKTYEADIIKLVERASIEKYVKPKISRQTRKLNKALYASPEFIAFWNAISQKTTYRVSVKRETLIENAVKAIKEAPVIQPLRIEVTKVNIAVKRGGVTAGMTGNRIAELGDSYDLPNIVAELQQATSLTRKTLVEILIKSGKLAEFIANPNDFIAQVAKVLKSELEKIVIDGIQYEKIDGSIYELRELQADGEEEKERFLDQMYQVQNRQKTDFDYVVYDSEVERKFAELLDSREDIKLFMKLPATFKVPTPVGDYNPDWAIIKQEGGHDQFYMVRETTSAWKKTRANVSEPHPPSVYMIRETKSTLEEVKRRPTENRKIKAAREHFKAIGIPDYEVATAERPGL